MKTLEQRLESKLRELEALRYTCFVNATIYECFEPIRNYWSEKGDEALDQVDEVLDQIELLKEIKGEQKMANYYVSFGTGAGDFVAYTTTWAKHLADEKAAYTQKDIKIFALADEKASYTQNDVKPLWVRKWWGIPFDDENACDVDPIKFGEFGYYSDWE